MRHQGQNLQIGLIPFFGLKRHKTDAWFHSGPEDVAWTGQNRTEWFHPWDAFYYPQALLKWGYYTVKPWTKLRCVSWECQREQWLWPDLHSIGYPSPLVNTSIWLASSRDPAMWFSENERELLQGNRDPKNCCLLLVFWQGRFMGNLIKIIKPLSEK